ncbi:small ribosomal subunit protein S13, mitochondrial-like [Rhodamnia argentea]|uniref:Small ribosomal subunit protein S13, mitochondrial-like n=1 Tax=Rhodamnia argentea TaxID=178133 RepID=A0A8B8QDI3_9MYRT|nr:small ribosomal subunit protein S13, mitochondrial-like [Rhodamnia argentea]
MLWLSPTTAPCNTSARLQQFPVMFALRASARRSADAGRRLLQNAQGVRGIRIGNTEVPDDKKLAYSLQHIKGIGRSTARQILCELQIENKPTRELSGIELELLRDEVLNYNIGHNVDQETASCIKRLVAIQSYRGIRHVAGLPCRGQRTSTNARTRKNRGTPFAAFKMTSHR